MEPTYCIHTFPLPFSFWKHYFHEGAHVVTPSIRHIPPQSIDPKIKCRSRMHWWLADQETHLVDPKAVSLCLDLNGNITETSGSNFLILQNGVLLTPSSRNILPGVSSNLGPAEKEVMQTEPVQVIVLILAEAPKTTPETLPICPLVEIPKGFSGP